MQADPKEALERLESSLSKEFPGIGHMRTSVASSDLRTIISSYKEQEARLAALTAACRPIVAAYDIQSPGKENWPDDRGAREWLPGGWPTTGDFRALRSALLSSSERGRPDSNPGSGGEP